MYQITEKILVPARRSTMMVDRSQRKVKGGEKMTTRKFGVEISHNRRVLGTINQRGGAQNCPCVVNKRALPNANGNDENIDVNQLHRPVTRKLAAQIANKKQCFPEDVLKPKQPIEDFKVWEDEEDEPVPMSLEKTEPQKDIMTASESSSTMDVFG